MRINNPQELTQLMEKLNSWQLVDENMFLAVENGEYSDEDSLEYEVPAYVLAELHPDFPVALRAQIEWTPQNTASSLPVTFGSSVIDNLALLQKGSYVFTDNTGKENILVNLSKFWVHDDGRNVSILGSQCDTQTIELDGRIIPFVTTSRHYCSTQVSVNTLDAQYPGWKTRSDIAENLGLAAEELMHYVFERTSPQLTAAGITFE